MITRSAWFLLVAILLGVLGCGNESGSKITHPKPQEPHIQPPIATNIRHVFVIVLENKGFEETFGAGSRAPYLANVLTSQGELLTQYYSIGHLSLDNYVAILSGQAPNPQTQGDCQTYSDFVPRAPGFAPYGQVVGDGCVYPAAVKTLADQLAAAGFTWKGYMEDMGNDLNRDGSRTCAHPQLNSRDGTQSAESGDQYAARHNPFVYFHSIIDKPSCQRNVVPLAELPADLRDPQKTPNFAFITPDLCNDGHDLPCVDGRPGGLRSADQFLQEWVPRIMASPVFPSSGLLIITFDESEGPQSDSRACCGELPGPNSTLPGIDGAGGGRTGTILISPFVKPGSKNDTAYNHYSLLRSIEDLFGLEPLGFAGQKGLPRFSDDVYNAAMR